MKVYIKMVKDNVFGIVEKNKTSLILLIFISTLDI